MPYIKGVSRDQMTMLPNSLEEYVEADNPVRVVDAFVERLELGALGFQAEPAVEGRPGYDPRDMLKLYIYGYLNKIRSSRKLQRETGRNIELMWLLGKIVPDFRCIADFRKNNAKAIKAVFREFVRLCNKAGLLSHEAVVIDGSKFRAANASNNCFVRANVEKMIDLADEKIAKYMAELDAADQSERREEELTKEEVQGALAYLEKRKTQLITALAQIDESGENHICTTDPECRLMKTRDGFKPSFNVQTAVEPDNHIIVNFDIADTGVDWNLLEGNITKAKAVLDVETLEGIADKGYCDNGEILKCLLNGDTPTVYPQKNRNCREFHFEKTDDDITSEMLASRDHEVLKKCVATGVLPDILKRDDISIEIQESSKQPEMFVDTETGELFSRAQLRNALKAERETVTVECNEPASHFFTRDLENDTVTCPMGQTLFRCGRDGRSHNIRYHRPSVCRECANKCTIAKAKNISFHPGETSKRTDFYDKCRSGDMPERPTSHRKYERLSLPVQGSVILKFYPNQHRLRIRNQIVEHPFGTVKRWNDGYYFLVKGKLKAAAEMALAYLGYNIKRVLNILGTQRLLQLINA